MRRYGVIDDKTFWRECAVSTVQVSQEELAEMDSASAKAFANLIFLRGAGFTTFEEELHAAAFDGQAFREGPKQGDSTRPNTHLGALAFAAAIEQDIRPS
jgi:hypothetical protein